MSVFWDTVANAESTDERSSDNDDKSFDEEGNDASENTGSDNNTIKNFLGLYLNSCGNGTSECASCSSSNKEYSKSSHSTDDEPYKNGKKEYDHKCSNL